jgi:hypothetical protein
VAKTRVHFKSKNGTVSFLAKGSKAGPRRKSKKGKRAIGSRWRKLEIRVGNSNQALSEHRTPQAALIAWRKAFRESTSAYIADYDSGEDVTLAVASLFERDREVAG